jgi:hypothetical protein
VDESASRCGEGEIDDKYGPAWPASFHPDLALMREHDFSANAQSQTGTDYLRSSTRFGPIESLENSRLMFFRNLRAGVGNSERSEIP